MASVAGADVEVPEVEVSAAGDGVPEACGWNVDTSDVGDGAVNGYGNLPGRRYGRRLKADEDMVIVSRGGAVVGRGEKSNDRRSGV